VAPKTAACLSACVLCDAAVEAVNDVESRVAIRGVKSLAHLLYSDTGHVGAEAGSLRGAEAVRFQLINALSSFKGRVETLEHRPPSRPELPALAPRNSLRVLVVEDNRDSAETLATSVCPIRTASRSPRRCGPIR
jgi:hypothetical protein